MNFVRIAKWCMFLLGAAWAILSGNALISLAKAFPSFGPKHVDSVYMFASLQGYLVVFAPLIIGLVLLVSTWPEAGLRTRSAKSTRTDA
jgi:hypothetical protein